MKKKILTTALAGLMVLTSFTTAFAGQWQQDEVGWWYQNDDGSYISNNWYQENEEWYYFNADGYMVTGWLHFTDTDKYYYFDEDGSMRTDPLTENGMTYTFDENGAWKNGLDSQIQDIYDREALRLKVKYGYGQDYNQHTYSGVNLADENLVSYHDIAQDR